MKEMLKNAGILLAITVIAGFVLGAVYQITKEPIALAKEAAVLQRLPGNNSIQIHYKPCKTNRCT